MRDEGSQHLWIPYWLGVACVQSAHIAFAALNSAYRSLFPVSWTRSSESFRFLVLFCRSIEILKMRFLRNFCFAGLIFWSTAKVLQLENLSYFLENLGIWHWLRQTCLPIKSAEKNDWNACLTCRHYTSTVSALARSPGPQQCVVPYISGLSFLFRFYFILLFLIIHQYFSIF